MENPEKSMRKAMVWWRLWAVAIRLDPQVREPLLVAAADDLRGHGGQGPHGLVAPKAMVGETEVDELQSAQANGDHHLSSPEHSR